MPFSQTAAPQAPLAEAGSPPQRGLETHAQILALLLRVSLGILLLPAFLVALVTALATRRRPQANGLWYLSAADQDSIDALPPRARHAIARLLAIIGWAMAGRRNRGMRPRPHATRTSGIRPASAPRAPPCPA